mmetsp:Transcript_10151/g.15020  ORF Transcript_10151/g.15020 Transcript_10151/m.15020 type:complete len:206 (-) Transcript_10151:27-644(-)
MKLFSLLALGSLPAASAFSAGRTAYMPRQATALNMAELEENTVSANPVIKVAASGMTLLKPVFQAEAIAQAKILGAIGKINPEDVANEIALNKKNNKVLIYTYSLSPFSTEAIRLLNDLGYEFTKIELGAEWFLLGGKESETRVALSREVDNGATSLPKIFIGEECIGGYSELAALVESGEIDTLMKKAKVPNKNAPAKKSFSLW